MLERLRSISLEGDSDVKLSCKIISLEIIIIFIYEMSLSSFISTRLMDFGQKSFLRISKLEHTHNERSITHEPKLKLHFETILWRQSGKYIISQCLENKSFRQSSEKSFTFSTAIACWFVSNLSVKNKLSENLAERKQRLSSSMVIQRKHEAHAKLIRSFNESIK